MSKASRRRTSAQVAFDSAVEGWQVLGQELVGTPPPSWRLASMRRIAKIASEAEARYEAIGQPDPLRLATLEAVRRIARWARRPAWTDDDQLRVVVDAVIEEQELERERRFYTTDWDVRDPSAREIWEHLERDAVADAKRGKFELLIQLLFPRDPFRQWLRSLGLELSRPAQQLVENKLTRSRLPGRGRGRPPMSKVERRAATPTHDAAAEFPAIEAILSARFPDKTASDVRNKAAAIAMSRAGVTSDTAADTLIDYLQHPSKQLR